MLFISFPPERAELIWKMFVRCRGETDEIDEIGMD
jgi:hypothetical protein